MNRFDASAVAATIALFGATAHAQTITTVTYDFPSTASGAFLFGWFGGNQPVEGWIVKTRVFIDYAAGQGQNAANFESNFDVPVLDPLGGTARMAISWAGLGWSGQGQFSYSDETDDFNGEIRTGRFGWALFGGGKLKQGSRIEFDVSEVPGPSVMGLMATGLLFGVRRRR